MCLEQMGIGGDAPDSVEHLVHYALILFFASLNYHYFIC
jgi:hypothetical protein